MKKSVFLFLSFCMLSFGYAQNKKIYTHPQFEKIAKDHKMLAILPFKASVKLRPKDMKNMTEEQHQELQEKEGKAVQSAMETYFLHKADKKNMSITFQSTSKTNAILSKSEITNENIDSSTAEELCKKLEVDAIIHGTLSTNQPMSEGAAVALNVAFGALTATNSGKITINITEGKESALLWKYEKQLSRSLGSDTESIITTMMRKASRKFPYGSL